MYKTLKMMIVNQWFAVLGDFKFQMICVFSLSLSFMVIILNEEFFLSFCFDTTNFSNQHL